MANDDMAHDSKGVVIRKGDTLEIIYSGDTGRVDGITKSKEGRFVIDLATAEFCEGADIITTVYAEDTKHVEHEQKLGVVVKDEVAKDDIGPQNIPDDGDGPDDVAPVVVPTGMKANNASDVLSAEIAEIGYNRWDDPEAGTKYGRWYADLVGDSAYAASGVAYCAMFQSYCFNEAGATCAGLPGAYCPSIVAAAKAAGATIDLGSAVAGDVLLFDWNGDRVADHIGMVEVNNGTYFQTIEGNTTINGVTGAVGRRTRAYSVVLCAVRPSYDGSDPTPDPTPDYDQIDEDGLWGSATTTALQRHFGTPVDGIVSGQWTGRKSILKACTTGWQFSAGAGGSLLIAAMQRTLGIPDDGVAGPQFINALEQRYGYAPDGRLDFPSNTVRKMQHALNNGTF